MRVFRHLLFVTIGLVASVGTLPAAETTHNFAVWENEVKSYEAQDKVHPPPQNAILFAGSSTIRFWSTLAADFPGQAVINRGFGGTEIVDSTHFADRLIFPHAPHAIFLRAGVNDIHDGKSAAQVFADFKEFVDVIHARLPETDIYFIGLCPTISRWTEAEANHETDRLVEAYARTAPRVHYIDAWDMSLDANGRPRPELFRDDKLHFTTAGYRILAERVRPYVH
ncbi:MAG TPA: GDSL-type esterase/lipase family protein [Candidatus Didemnitutus sp.]|jgi:lysophospholipase L1-like esterase